MWYYDARGNSVYVTDKLLMNSWLTLGFKSNCCTQKRHVTSMVLLNAYRFVPYSKAGIVWGVKGPYSAPRPELKVWVLTLVELFLLRYFAWQFQWKIVLASKHSAENETYNLLRRQFLHIRKVFFFYTEICRSNLMSVSRETAVSVLGHFNLTQSHCCQIFCFLYV